MNDFETKLKTLLNEQVDAQVGPRRTPPPFAVPAAARRAQRHWFGRDHVTWTLPLIAAACVAVVVAGSVGLSDVLADHKQPQQQPGHRSSIPVTTQSPSSSAAPYTATTTPAPHHVPGTHLEHALGATLVLPDGWRIAPDPYGGQGIGEGVCIRKTGDSKASCPIQLNPLRPDQAAGAAFDVDVTDLGRGDLPTLCDGGHAQPSWDYADRTFGGRPSDWRSWEYTCPGSGETDRIDQWAVVTPPGFLLQLTVGRSFSWLTSVSSPADIAELHDVINSIAENSALPAQTAPLRLFDRGVITSVTRSGGGVTIALDRTVAHGSSCVNRNPETYTYVVPTNVFDAKETLRVGSQVVVVTDGSTVLRIDKDASC